MLGIECLSSWPLRIYLYLSEMTEMVMFEEKEIRGFIVYDYFKDTEEMCDVDTSVHPKKKIWDPSHASSEAQETY